MEAESGHATVGLRWRVAASIVLAFGWIIFVLLYSAFPPESFSLFQNIVVVLVSILAGVMFLAVVWASYGLRFARAEG